MSSKDKNLTPVQQEYKKFEQQREPKRPVLKNCIKAFFVGGIHLFDRPTDFNFLHLFF